MVQRLSVVASLAWVGLLAGCVRPGWVDPTTILRYQEAMAGRGPQQRVGRTGLNALRPAPQPGAPKLTFEKIVVGRRIETTVAHQVVGPVGQRKRVRVTATVKATRFVRDPKTGERTPRVEVKTTTAGITVKELPKDTRTVEIIRVGDETETPALTRGAQSMVHLSLEQAILVALLYNLDIRVVSFDPAVSREQMVQAAAEFDYVVGASYGFDNTDERTASPFGGGRQEVHSVRAELSKKTITGATWSAAYDMTRTWDNSGFSTLAARYEPQVLFEITQPLLRDGWPEFNLAGVRIARLSHKISLAAFRQRVEEVITEVISTYWRLCQARRDVAIQKKLLALTRQTYKKVKLREGLDATAVEINQSRAAFASRRADLMVAEKIVIDAQEVLARLLAHPEINALSDCEVVLDSEPVTTEVRHNVAGQLITALRHSPQLEQARLAIRSAQINVRVAENQVLPRADLRFDIGWQGLARHSGEAHRIMAANNYRSYGLSIAVEYPLGNRARRAALRASRFQHAQAIAELQTTADQVATVVKERIRQARTSYQVLQAQRSAVEAVSVQLEALEATERIRGKLTPEFLQVKLNAQASLAAAERAELAAAIDYNVALVELARTTGTVLELNRVKLALPTVLADAGP